MVMSRLTNSLLLLLLLLLSSSGASAASSNSTNTTDPVVVVDLPYALYAAQSVVSPDTRTYYNFSNMRYAAPPLGALRFQPPQDPADERSAGMQDGSDSGSGSGKICPQAYTPWQSSAAATAPPGEMESEDCLLLDVVVPEEAWAANGSGNGSRHPVIVWIHGGGFQIGAKWGAPATNPLGLLDRSYDGDGEGAIWVGLNYRLGAFGWLQGESFESSGGVPNVGLYDQRKALDWVQKYIARFGGDPSRVTVMGESAGAGSIAHHLTAYGGKNATPAFHQAILQSPAYVPRPYASQARDSFSALLAAANASTLAGLAALDTYGLQVANKRAQGSDVYGTFQFGPAPDGSFVPDLPEKLLARGEFHKGVKVLVAHNTYEGQKYTDPAATNSSAFDAYMKLYFPDAPGAVLAELSASVYPAVYNDTASYPWTTPFERLMTAVSDFTFSCHAYFIGAAAATAAAAAAAAANNGTTATGGAYSYLFSVPPGTHTLDVHYSYYMNSSWDSTVTNVTTARYLQEYITNFAEEGNPNSEEGEEESLPFFPAYYGEGQGYQVLNLNGTFVDVRRDPAANDRCEWWWSVSYS